MSDFTDQESITCGATEHKSTIHLVTMYLVVVNGSILLNNQSKTNLHFLDIN